MVQDGKSLSLAEWPESSSSIAPHQHVLLPDANVLLHQMDVITDDIFTHLLVLQTVWDEARLLLFIFPSFMPLPL